MSQLSANKSQVERKENLQPIESIISKLRNESKSTFITINYTPIRLLNQFKIIKYFRTNFIQPLIW